MQIQALALEAFDVRFDRESFRRRQCARCHDVERHKNREYHVRDIVGCRAWRLLPRELTVIRVVVGRRDRCEI